MRYQKKSWQDKRPGWKKRVRWYEGLSHFPIRLEFQDEHGRANLFFTDPDDAQIKWEQFIEGELDTLDILRGQVQ